MNGVYRGSTANFLIMAELIRAAQYRGITTYEDLAKILGLPTEDSGMWTKIVGILGAISEDEVAAGRPMLGVLAVDRGNRDPALSLLAQTLGRHLPNEADSVFWKRERRALYRVWSRSAPPSDERAQRLALGSRTDSDPAFAETLIAPGRSLGIMHLGMSWDEARAIVSDGQFGKLSGGGEEENLNGRVIRTSIGVIGDYSFLPDDEPSDASVYTPGQVAYLGTEVKRFRLALPSGEPSGLGIGADLSAVLDAFGTPSGHREQNLYWSHLGLEIEPSLHGRGEKVGFIGVFPPKLHGRE